MSVLLSLSGLTERIHGLLCHVYVCWVQPGMNANNIVFKFEFQEGDENIGSGTPVQSVKHCKPVHQLDDVRVKYDGGQISS